MFPQPNPQNRFDDLTPAERAKKEISVAVGLFTFADVAGAIGVPEWRVWRVCAKNLLPAIRLSAPQPAPSIAANAPVRATPANWRISSEALAAFMRSGAPDLYGLSASNTWIEETPDDYYAAESFFTGELVGAARADLPDEASVRKQIEGQLTGPTQGAEIALRTKSVDAIKKTCLEKAANARYPNQLAQFAAEKLRQQAKRIIQRPDFLAPPGVNPLNFLYSDPRVLDAVSQLAIRELRDQTAFICRQTFLYQPPALALQSPSNDYGTFQRAGADGSGIDQTRGATAVSVAGVFSLSFKTLFAIAGIDENRLIALAF
jgi:hypothetical protein